MFSIGCLISDLLFRGDGTSATLPARRRVRLSFHRSFPSSLCNCNNFSLSHTMTPHMTLCPSSNELCHTYALPYAIRTLNALRTPLSHLLQNRSHSFIASFPRLFYSLTHPFVPATTTNKLVAFPSLFYHHRVSLPSCLVATSPLFFGVLEYSSNLVHFQSYSHPPIIEPSQVVPFPPRAKRTSLARAPTCPTTLSSYRLCLSQLGIFPILS